MQHLGIDDTKETLHISEQTVEEQVDSIKPELSAYLEKLVGVPIISPDENGSYDAFLELKRVLNDSHKALRDGVNLAPHWKETGRFFSENKIKALLDELGLPFCIKSESANKQRTTTITKLD